MANFTLPANKVQTAKTVYEALVNDPKKAAVIDQLHKLIHAIAISDPVADRAKIDGYLKILSIVGFFVPGLGSIISMIQGIVDMPGGMETVVQVAGILDGLLPPLPA